MALVKDKLEVADVTVEELNVTSAVLIAGAHHLGNYCKEEFKTYMQKADEKKDPRAVLEDGKRVTACALGFFRKMKENCNTVFTKHWKCLDYNNMFYGLCRDTQKPYDACVLENFGLESEQLDIVGPLPA